MRKLQSVLCVLCLILLVPLLLRAHELLPLDTRPLVEEKYAGWSGVLRLWIFEGWPCGKGGISPWLTRCISDFEKAHPGVYIQPRFVDEGALASINDSGILPPDMILFPPDLLSDPVGLLPLKPRADLRPALADSGRWNGSIYAMPVAMGGYAWAWNASLIGSLPDSWRDSDATLSVLPPGRWRQWGAALLALSSGLYSPARDDAGTEDLPEGLDLSLSGTEAPIPTVAPPADGEAALSRHLPEGFQYDDNAWTRFINEEAAAMPVTQREVVRLRALSDLGKGPDWRLSRGDHPFTDQLLFLALTDRPDAADQQALCGKFLSLLLSEECQGALHLVSAFSVTEASSGYAPGDPLLTMEAALRDEALCVPRCFDDQWIPASESIVREFISDSGDVPSLWARFEAIVGKQAND